MADRNDDAATIEAVLHGDADRYAELVDRYQDQAIGLAFSLLGNREDALDASQDAFVSAYRALPRFRGGAKFSTWLFRIVVNKCQDAGRRRHREPVVALGVGIVESASEDGSLFVDVADAAGDPRDQAASHELSLRISHAIGQLPMTQRTALVLHHLQGLSLDEIAQVMGCRLGTVKSHLFRATARLRTQLTPWLAQQEDR